VGPNKGKRASTSLVRIDDFPQFESVHIVRNRMHIKPYASLPSFARLCYDLLFHSLWYLVIMESKMPSSTPASSPACSRNQETVRDSDVSKPTPYANQGAWTLASVPASEIEDPASQWHKEQSNGTIYIVGLYKSAYEVIINPAHRPWLRRQQLQFDLEYNPTIPEGRQKDVCSVRKAAKKAGDLWLHHAFRKICSESHTEVAPAYYYFACRALSQSPTFSTATDWKIRMMELIVWHTKKIIYLDFVNISDSSPSSYKNDEWEWVDTFNSSPSSYNNCTSPAAEIGYVLADDMTPSYVAIVFSSLPSLPAADYTCTCLPNGQYFLPNSQSCKTAMMGLSEIETPELGGPQDGEVPTTASAGAEPQELLRQELWNATNALVELSEDKILQGVIVNMVTRREDRVKAATFPGREIWAIDVHAYDKIGDCELSLPFKRNSAAFVNLRDSELWLRNKDSLFDRIACILQPGGWLQHSEMRLSGWKSNKTEVNQWRDHVLNYARTLGYELPSSIDVRKSLEERGFGEYRMSQRNWQTLPRNDFSDHVRQFWKLTVTASHRILVDGGFGTPEAVDELLRKVMLKLDEQDFKGYILAHSCLVRRRQTG
jgi:hypothetical protein